MLSSLQQPLYFDTPVIIRRESFGGIVHLIHKKAFVEINNEGFEILSMLAEKPLSIHEIFQTKNLVSQEERAEITKFIQDGISYGLLSYVSQNVNVKVIKELPFSNNIVAPIEAYFYLTDKCNQNCSFCYFHKNAFKKLLPEQKWISLIDECVDLGVCTLGFLGGEPLLEKELLLNLLQYSDGRMSQAITTNGTARGGIDKSLAERFGAFQGLEINISLESLNEKTHDKLVQLPGATKSAIRSVENIVEVGKNPVVIKTLASQNNYHELPQLVAWAKKTGVNGVYILDYMPSFGESYASFINNSLQPEKYWELLNELETFADSNFFVLACTKYRFVRQNGQLPSVSDFSHTVSTCAAGSINIDFMPNGDVFSCPLTNGNPNYCLGNVNHQTVKELWLSPKLDVFRRRSPEKLTSSVCQNCNNKEECLGGCMVCSDIFTGSPYGGDIRCPLLVNNIKG